MSTLSERLLHSDKVFLLDGGTGEELFRKGVPDDRKLWSATAIVHSEYHSILEEVHVSFLHAGAQAITTNSYGIIPGVGFHNDNDRHKYIDMAGRIARRAATKSGKEDAFVLGSLGPLVESYRADLIRSHAHGVQEYRIACQALRPHVDAFLAETMSCLEESMQALEAVMETELPVLVSFTLDSSGHLRGGQVVTDCLRQLLDYVQQSNVKLLAILFNCSEPEAITLALAQIKSDKDLSDGLQDSGIRLGAYANRLTAVDPAWTLADSTAPQPLRQDLDEKHYWKDFVRIWISELNVKIVGGCCGITPEHIAYLHTRLAEHK